MSVLHRHPIFNTLMGRVKEGITPERTARETGAESSLVRKSLKTTPKWL
jgi:hypothetical protein